MNKTKQLAVAVNVHDGTVRFYEPGTALEMFLRDQPFVQNLGIVVVPKEVWSKMRCFEATSSVSPYFGLKVYWPSRERPDYQPAGVV